MEDLIILKNDILYCQVCVIKEMSNREIEETTNNINPTGISSKWVIESERVQCEADKNRIHLILVY